MPVAIETVRLTLREYQPGDHAALHALLSEPVTMQFWPAPFTQAQTEAWLARQIASYTTHGFGHWAVCQRDTGAQIGDVGLMHTQVNDRDEIDLGYIIHSSFWRQGYALEAARAALEFARAQPTITRVVANMPYNHHGSRRIAEALGMHYAGDFINTRNRNIRTLLYAIAI